VTNCADHLFENCAPRPLSVHGGRPSVVGCIARRRLTGILRGPYPASMARGHQCASDVGDFKARRSREMKEQAGARAFDTLEIETLFERLTASDPTLRTMSACVQSCTGLLWIFSVFTGFLGLGIESQPAYSRPTVSRRPRFSLLVLIVCSALTWSCALAQRASE
jgi:hypothetical protein